MPASEEVTEKHLLIYDYLQDPLVDDMVSLSPGCSSSHLRAMIKTLGIT
jgi:hypothetical protein